jgi:hypothetical protein
MLAASTVCAQEGNARALAIAKRSRSAAAAMRSLRREAKTLSDPALRAFAVSMLSKPAPGFMSRLADDTQRERVRAALVAEALLDARVPTSQLFPPLPSAEQPPLSFLAAPGGTLDGHHAYPGGLAEHTAFNVRAASDLAANYRALYGIRVSRDEVIAAAMLHDAMKAWVLQWKPDGTLTEQATVGGTASHHIFVIAEALHRGLPARFVVTLAAAHESTGLGATKVVHYLRAAALLAGVDAVERKLLAREGEGWRLAEPLPTVEASIHHLSDHDFVLTEPAAKALHVSLDALLTRRGVPAQALRWKRYEVEASSSGITLYQRLRTEGERGLEDAVRAVVRDGK